MLARALEQVGFVDGRLQQDFVGSALLAHGAGLRDQLEGSAARGRLLARVSIEHRQGQQRVGLADLVARLAGERQSLLGVGPFVAHLVGGAAGEGEKDLDPGGGGHLAWHVGQRGFQVAAEVLAAQPDPEMAAVPEHLRDPDWFGGWVKLLQRRGGQRDAAFELPGVVRGGNGLFQHSGVIRADPHLRVRHLVP